MRIFALIFFMLALVFAADVQGQINCEDPSREGWFIRGDVDNNGSVDFVTDWINLNNYLWFGGEPPCNLDAADVNDDGAIDISDQIALQNWFRGYFDMPAPYPEPGDDPTGDFLQNDTSPMPNGDGYRPEMTITEWGEGGGPGEPESGFGRAYARDLAGADQWNVSADYPPGGIFFDSRILESSNTVCNGDGKTQADVWKVTFQANRRHPYPQRLSDSVHKGHVTKKALTSSQRNGKSDVVIKLTVYFDMFINLDCECVPDFDSDNAVKISLGYRDDQGKPWLDFPARIWIGLVTSERHGDDQDVLILEKKYEGLLFSEAVSWTYENGCQGSGWTFRSGPLDFEFDGEDIMPIGGQPNGKDIELGEKLKIDSVMIDGIVHLSDNSPVEITELEAAETEVRLEIEYDWR